jgi:hypothetical protein
VRQKHSRVEKSDTERIESEAADQVDDIYLCRAEKSHIEGIESKLELKQPLFWWEAPKSGKDKHAK